MKEEPEGIQPTRPMSTYLFFSNETIPKLKAEEGIAHKDAMSAAGKRWNALTEEEKEPYNKMHEEAVQR